MTTKDYTSCPQYSNESCKLTYVKCEGKDLCCFQCKVKGCRWRCVSTDNMSDVEKNFRRY